MTEQKIFLHNSVDFWNIRIRHSMASGKDRYEREGAAIMLLVHTYILLPHAVTKYGAHADITRRKMRGYDAFALQKQTHPTPTGSPPPPQMCCQSRQYLCQIDLRYAYKSPYRALNRQSYQILSVLI